TRRVAATPARVAEAMDGVRLGGAASLLVRIRGLRLPSGPIREVLTGSGFTALAERPGFELVAGTNGRIWALREQAHMEAPVDRIAEGPECTCRCSSRGPWGSWAPVSTAWDARSWWSGGSRRACCHPAPSAVP